MNKRQILRELVEEERRLDIIIHDTEERLKKAPEGKVRIVRQKDKVQFYHRTVAGDTNGKYMPSREFDKAAALIQKKYDEEVLKAANKQLSAIISFLIRNTKCDGSRKNTNQNSLLRTYRSIIQAEGSGCAQNQK